MCKLTDQTTLSLKKMISLINEKNVELKEKIVAEAKTKATKQYANDQRNQESMDQQKKKEKGLLLGVVVISS